MFYCLPEILYFDCLQIICRLVLYCCCHFSLALLIIVNFSFIEIILYPIIYRHINKILNKTASTEILRPEIIQVNYANFLGCLLVVLSNSKILSSKSFYLGSRLQLLKNLKVIQIASNHTFL